MKEGLGRQAAVPVWPLLAAFGLFALWLMGEWWLAQGGSGGALWPTWLLYVGIAGAGVMWLRRWGGRGVQGGGGAWLGLGERRRGAALLLLVLALFVVSFTWALGAAPAGAREPLGWWTLHVVLWVPLLEELLFRGVLLALLLPLVGRWGAVAGVSAFFVLMHTPAQASVAVALGLLAVLAAWSVLFFRTVGWAVAIHMAWNTAAQVLSLAPGGARVAVAGGVGALLLGAGAVTWYRSRGVGSGAAPLTEGRGGAVIEGKH